MSQAGLETFERTLHETNIWLKEVGEACGGGDRQRSYRVLKGVLQALRDRLTIEEAVQFGAQLPMLMRGFYYEGWRASETPLKIRTKEEFLARVQRNLHDMLNEIDGVDIETVTRALFTVVNGHVSGGEIADVRQQLPEDVRSLWLEPPAA